MYLLLLLHTAKVAQSSSSQYCFVLHCCPMYFRLLLVFFILQSLQYFLVLLRAEKKLHYILFRIEPFCTACTKLSPSYFELQRLCITLRSTICHYKVLNGILPSTTSYSESCAEYFLELVCTRKLAHNSFEYYFVLQQLLIVV